MSLLSLAIAALLAADHQLLAPGDHTRSLQVDGRTRSYLVHIPPKYVAVQPTPVVLVFHGALMNASLMARFCGLNEKSDKEGFIAVYPNGTGRLDFGHGTAATAADTPNRTMWMT